MKNWKPVALLAMLPVLMAAQCQTIPTTDRPGTGKLAISQQLNRICAEWRVMTYDSTKDTPETVKDARANNRARKGFGCR